MKTPLFKGAATALITPFCGENIDYKALSELIERQIDAGIDALVVGGTTGEAPTLSDKEHRELIEFCIKKADGRVGVIAGTGSAGTAKTVALTAFARDAGALGALVVTPYYNRPTQSGLYAHFEAVAAVGLPILLYDIPSRTGSSLSIPLRKKLSALPTVAGLKEAGDSLSVIAATMQSCGDELPLYAGNDNAAYTILSLGGAGVISVLSNLYPAEVGALCRAYCKGRHDEAFALQCRFASLIDALFAETNPAPVKCAMALKGYCRNDLRLPLVPVAPETKVRLMREMQVIDG